MRQVPLRDGGFALVDDADYPRVSRIEWRAEPDGRTHYAISRDRKKIRMHRFVLRLGPSDPIVDHKNGRGLDNRRRNLRACGSTHNARNRQNASDKLTSRCKGVDHQPNRDRPAKWRARITVGNCVLFLGYFREEKDAALAYDKAARKHFRDFSAFNFPLPGERPA